jgi:hypothetical protein
VLRLSLGRWWGSDGRSVAAKRGHHRRGVVGAGGNTEAPEGGLAGEERSGGLATSFDLDGD